MAQMLWPFLLSVVCASTVSVGLQANWSAPPFQIQLIEAAAALNESTYFQALNVLFGEHDEDFEWEEEHTQALALHDHDIPDSDKAYYDTIASTLSQTQVGFLNLYLMNQIYSPRIEAHYVHYENDVSPDLESQVLKQCVKDSFGEQISDPTNAWVKYGSKIYCSASDLFALQLDKSSESILEFDRPVGSNKQAPLIVLYGSLSSERLPEMLSTLLQLADAGKLQFVWRYTPPTVKSLTNLTGFGKVLSVKKTNGPLKQKRVRISDLPSFLQQNKGSQVFDVSDEDLPKISSKIVSHILKAEDSKRLELLSQLLKNLPLYAPYLAISDAPSNCPDVEESARKNERLGASRDLVGISINGALVNRLDSDMPFIIQKLRDEVDFVNSMQHLGFTAAQTKKIFSKFSLLSAYTESEYRSGSSENRFTFYKEIYDVNKPNSGGVVFFNDVEADENYSLYTVDRHEAYIKDASRLRRGQIPPLRENVHDIVFVLNFSNRGQLKVFFAMAKLILDQGFPQQVGVVPIVENAKDAKIASMFYHIVRVGEIKEALGLLYKFYESEEQDEDALFNMVPVPEEESSTGQYNLLLEKYSITEASVIINGVIHSLRSKNWQARMGQQISHDVMFLQKMIKNGMDVGEKLKDLLYAGAKSFRNLKITPLDPGNIRYKRVTLDLIEHSDTFVKHVDSTSSSMTFWLIGDFNSNTILDQMKQILEFMRSYTEKNVQLRVLDIAKKSPLLADLKSRFSQNSLDIPSIKQMIDIIGDVRIETVSELDPIKLNVLERNNIQSHRPILLYNSRQFILNTVFDVRELHLIQEFESKQRLSLIENIFSSYPEHFEGRSIMDFSQGALDKSTWYDLLTSTISASFNIEDSLVVTDVGRFDFSSLNYNNSIDVNGYDESKPLDILITIDPVDEFSQKLISFIPSLLDLGFVNIRVLLQPFSQLQEKTSLNRFYASGFVRSIPEFSIEGHFIEPTTEVFSVPSTSLYYANIDVHPRWHYIRGDVSDQQDVDNLVLNEGEHRISFTLTRFAVDAFVKNVKDASPIPNLSFTVEQNKLLRQGLSMDTMGYCQLLLEPGIWQMKINSDSNGLVYDLLSVNENKYTSNDTPHESVPVGVFSLSGKLVHVRMRESPRSSAVLKPKKKQPDINIFSIARGKNYEKLMAIMMISVKKHTTKRVKFWLLEEFLSPSFLKQLPLLADAFSFEYELVAYNWPIWLRKQKAPNRVVWGYKILFLDVLFPKDIEKVIFVDADQIARTDLYDLVTTDLHGVPYGFTPMCDSRSDVEGFRFWKQGYWETVLKDDLKYHISALYVVDLKVFREQKVGDQLRAHYQKLSSDPNSLANLDQDLPNNLQRQIPIFSLPQDWLWCETWCSQDSKKTAKMIDLCNDPTSSESKLERARRSIPEWEGYNMELQKVGNGELEILHDEL